MKKLTEKELQEAPNDVQYVYMCSIINHPIGINTYQEAVKKHPEYFPEEVEYNKKWNLIPQEVHDSYWKEYLELDKEIMKNVPPSKGIFGWAKDPEGLNEWEKTYYEAEEKGRPLRKELHQKHYSKYGIDFQ